MPETVRTRFAPSPTGHLHLGHALAAKVAETLARLHQGTFLLRHEDIDGGRVKPEFYGELEDDLRWLGLEWDEPAMRQTERLSAYDEALTALRDRGLVYPCFCTRREIQAEWKRSASAPQGDLPPVYPGTCRKLSDAERRSRISQGRSYAWRLDSTKATATTGPLTFHDLRHGVVEVDPTLSGDCVLARKDIGIAYHLAVVVDDAFQDISHVTRGDDLLFATHVHRILQELLELPQPLYLHHALVVDESGKRLAKRDAARSLRHFRESGSSASEVLARIDPLLQRTLREAGQG